MPEPILILTAIDGDQVIAAIAAANREAGTVEWSEGGTVLRVRCGRTRHPGKVKMDSVKSRLVLERLKI